MADSLYLSLWFPSFDEGEMTTRALAVLRQFPYSSSRPGIAYLSVHPVAWQEPTVLERRFTPGVAPEEAIEIANEFAHDDYAFVFEAFWDLWYPGEDENAEGWAQRPVAVKFLIHGVQFDEGIYVDDGHVEVDFGLDTPFLYESVEISRFTEKYIRENVVKLVAFSSAIEKNCAVSGRVLWSESEENLAQKLIAKLQQTQ